MEKSPPAALCTDNAKEVGERGSLLARSVNSETARSASPWREQNTIGRSRRSPKQRCAASNAILAKPPARRRNIGGISRSGGSLLPPIASLPSAHADQSAALSMPGAQAA